jgi:hypothetical protein
MVSFGKQIIQKNSAIILSLEEYFYYKMLPFDCIVCIDNNNNNKLLPGKEKG